MNVKELAKRIRSGDAPAVIDVRSGFEFRSGHIPGALHIPFFKLMLRMARLPEDRSAEYLVTCEQGPRAQIALSLLAKRGFSKLKLLEGQMHQWRSLGLPLDK